MKREAEEKDRVGEREEWVAPSRLQSVLFLKFYKVTGTTIYPSPFPRPPNSRGGVQEVVVGHAFMNIFNSPELVANKQIITNTRKKRKNNTLNKY